jgi:hypothetical protein
MSKRWEIGAGPLNGHWSPKRRFEYPFHLDNRKKGSEGKKLFMKPLIWPEINGLVTFQRDPPQCEWNRIKKQSKTSNRLSQNPTKTSWISIWPHSATHFLFGANTVEHPPRLKLLSRAGGPKNVHRKKIR